MLYYYFYYVKQNEECIKQKHASEEPNNNPGNAAQVLTKIYSQHLVHLLDFSQALNSISWHVLFVRFCQDTFIEVKNKACCS